MLGRTVLVIIETLKYLKIFIFISANVYKPLSFEFAVTRKFVKILSFLCQNYSIFQWICNVVQHKHDG